MLAPSEIVKEPQVWRAPGNVTIEKRPPQLPSDGLPLGVAQPKPAAPQAAFQPAPPAVSGDPFAACPAVEELPVVAQNAIKAAQAGGTTQLGLAAQKTKVGFLERLANVGRSRKEPERRDVRQSASRNSASNGRPRDAQNVGPATAPAQA